MILCLNLILRKYRKGWNLWKLFATIFWKWCKSDVKIQRFKLGVIKIMFSVVTFVKEQSVVAAFSSESMLTCMFKVENMQCFHCKCVCVLRLLRRHKILLLSNLTFKSTMHIVRDIFSDITNFTPSIHNVFKCFQYCQNKHSLLTGHTHKHTHKHCFLWRRNWIVK